MSSTPSSVFAALRYWRNRSLPTQWAWAAAAGVVLASVVTLLLLLIQATDNTRSYERNFRLLVGLNIGIVAVLVLVIALVVGRLWLRLKRGKFGSRLLMRLAAILALMGILPGVLIYTVSVQFVSRSIESWFDVKVEAALESGLNLGRASLDALADELGSRTRAAAAELADTSAVSAVAVDRIRERLNADSVTLWSSSGQALANAQAAGSAISSFGLTSDRPSASAMRNARSSRVTVQIDAANTDNTAYSLRALALVPTPGFGLTEQPRYLQVVTAVPAALAANTAAVEAAYTEYQERAIGRQGLQRMYLGTLTLALFLSIFAAVLMAVLLGNQIAQPLLVLADGVRQVAEGDLSPKRVMGNADELGGLTRSFASMTQQLADARAAAEHSNSQVAAARSSLQTILDNLTAGVLVVSADGRLIAANPGATRVLRAPLGASLGRPLAEVAGLTRFAQMVQDQFETLAAEGTLRDNDYWQQSFDLNVIGQMGVGDGMAGLTGLAVADAPASLLCRGALLPDGTRLVVIDDLTELISAQRAVAWGEVARRLAHEIKNPLTPIQLSAERLQHKLAAQLDEPGGALLARSVNTIVTQVGAMQRLVNEFRDYARLPSAELAPMDLNALVQEVLSMYDSQTAVHVEVALDEDLPFIEGDAEQLRQVVHNLLQNAMDASEGLPERQVTLRTQWLHPSAEGGGGLGRVRLVITDNGTGFAEKVLKRAFEPYVTTKTKGTGLGLAVVKKIIEEHGARIDLSNRTSSRADGRRRDPGDSGEDTQVTGARVSIIFSRLAGRTARGAAVPGGAPAVHDTTSHT
jgi:nitrogen fixation/metabolism regulation signal transduction histidine kinase